MANYPGSFKARAAKAGAAPGAYAEANKGADGNLGKLARLAFLRQGVHGSGGATLGVPGDKKRTGADTLYQIG